MRKSSALSKGVALGFLAMAMTGCGHHRFTAGGPDEFAVARQAPLVIPPDYALVPPRPGAASTNGTSASSQALDALFGGNTARSPGERATLGEAGQDVSQAGIRSAAGDPDTNVVDKGATTRDIVAAPQGDGQDASVRTK